MAMTDTPEETCPETMVVTNMADLPLDCILPVGHGGPHWDSTTNARWIP
jgi:hypothetical protein